MSETNDQIRERIMAGNESESLYRNDKPTPSKAKCLNPKCVRTELHRGLCSSCYQIARLLVIKNRTTWAKLEAGGKCKSTTGTKTKKGTVAWLTEATPTH